MKSLQFSSMKSKGNILSLSILVLLFITLFGCQPNNGKNRGDAYDFMRFESNSTLKMYEKESMPEADKPCRRQVNLASSCYRQTS